MAINYKPEEFSFLEPYGHSQPESKFERYLQRFSGPFRLNRNRVPQFSVYAGMSHFPLKYTMSPFLLKSELPTDKWIYDNFQNFVKTEFSGNDDSSLPTDWPPKVEREIQLPNHYFEKFLVASEWSNRINIRLPDGNSPHAIASSIYDLLCDSKVGSNKNLANNGRDEFIDRIVPTIKDKSRLLFVLPGFPFKDQNRFRVPFDGGIPDMGEISFMIRLYNLTQTIYQVHPYGVDIVILSDGELYQDIFGVDGDMVLNYMKRLISYRYRLNLQGAISFLSLKELINRSSEESKAWEIARFIREKIVVLVNSGRPEIDKCFHVLTSGMKWNLESRNSMAKLSDNVCWTILRGKESDIKQEYKEMWHKVNDRALKAAFEYASINLMLRWTDLISCYFPDAIRGTIHPKPGQFALAGSGGTYAWNGVASSKKWPINIDDIRVVPFMSLNSFSKINQVKFEDTDLPCFYTESTLNANIEAAKQVLTPAEWSFENISGRELSTLDLNDFIELGVGDENFTWERKLQTENYFTGLFQFRISHYKKYGFGVHGIWLDNKLIGQFGLQVLNEYLDELELVVFLGKEYTRQGLGIKLVGYIFERCRKFGIMDLYGIVRPDNQAALKLLNKIGGRQIKTIKHFGQEGILCNINLNKG